MKADSMALLTRDQPENCYRFRLPFDAQRREFLPDKLLCGRFAYILVDQRLTGRSVLHETGSYIDRVTNCTIGTAVHAATSACPCKSLAHANLHFCDEIHLQIA